MSHFYWEDNRWELRRVGRVHKPPMQKSPPDDGARGE